MYKRNQDAAVVCGILCVIFVFLSMGSAYAICGNVCVLEPSSGDVLYSGKLFYIEVDIPADPFFFPVKGYKLFYTCVGPDFQVDTGGGTCEEGETCLYTNARWKLITQRNCNPYTGCPLTYPWFPPYLGSVEVSGGDGDGFCETSETCTWNRRCAVKLEVRDTANQILGINVGDTFTIKPSRSDIQLTPYLVPYRRIVLPGGSASFTISGGTPPYTVTTDNPGIITITGSTTKDPSTITVANSLVCGTDTKVLITVQDSSVPPAGAGAIYWIDCP